VLQVEIREGDIMEFKTVLLACILGIAAIRGAYPGGSEAAGAGEEAPPAEERTVIAVLPFRHASEDAHYEPLAESMGEMIVAQLARLEKLAFVERTELDKVLKEHELSLSGLVDPETKAKVGGLLGATYVLTGGVTVVEKKLKISAHLFEVETTRVVRSESAEGEVENLMPVVHAVAQKLAQEMNLELPEIKEEDIDKSPEANLHFMRGLGYYYGNMPDHAIAEFMKTLVLKPDHARARYWNGVCYFDDKEYEHAKIEFDRFLKESPEHELAPKIKEMVDACASHIEKREPAENGE